MYVPKPGKVWEDVRRAIATQIPPDDGTFAHRVYSVITQNQPDEVVRYALDLIEEQDYRDVLAAFLLSGATLQETAQSLGIPHEVVSTFAQIYMDLSQCRNKLELFKFATNYMESPQCSERGKDLIGAGIRVGPEYLVYIHQHGHDSITFDSKEYAKSLTQQAFHLSSTAKYNKITSESCKEALKWLNTAAKLLASMEKLTPQKTNITEALVEITESNPTKTLEDLGVTKDDVYF